MAASKSERIEVLLKKALDAEQDHDIERATKLYRRILEVQPSNEKALIWLAWHTTDAYEARDYLRKIVAIYPQDQNLRKFLEKAEERCQELDQLVNSSEYLSHWNNTEQALKERLRQNRDLRPGGVPKLGQVLIDDGYITTEQLENAIDLQLMFKGLGEEKRLGEMLLDFGYVTPEQLNNALSAQDKEYQSQFY